MEFLQKWSDRSSRISTEVKSYEPSLNIQTTVNLTEPGKRMGNKLNWLRKLVPAAVIGEG